MAAAGAASSSKARNTKNPHSTDYPRQAKLKIVCDFVHCFYIACIVRCKHCHKLRPLYCSCSVPLSCCMHPTSSAKTSLLLHLHLKYAFHSTSCNWASLLLFSDAISHATLLTNRAPCPARYEATVRLHCQCKQIKINTNTSSKTSILHLLC